MADIEVAGARYHYVDEGTDRGGGTVVFAHGLLWSGEMFRPQIDGLRDRYRCVAFDFRGQGRSAVTPSGYGMDALADDAAAIIERLGAAPCHFVGLSMGGFVGMRLAARRPGLLRSLSLLGTAGDGEPRINAPKYAALGAIARLVGTGPIVDRVMKIMFGRAFLEDPARQALREEQRRWLAGLDRIGTVRALWGVILRGAVEGELERVRVPTLVLSGEDDRAVNPARSRRTAGLIPGARFELVPRAGHTMTIEEPAAVNQALARFLASVAPG